MKTEAVVLKLTGNALFDAGFTIPQDVDWQAVCEECNKQTVTVLGFCGAKQAEVLAPEVRNRWEKDVAAIAFQNYRVTFSHQKLHQLMEDAGIPYVILKGCASAAYYPRPMERLMGDVDFLVRKSDLERAGKILEENGRPAAVINTFTAEKQSQEIQMEFPVDTARTFPPLNGISSSRTR